MNQDFIYLASASPRRRELLSQIGVAFRVQPADIPEIPRPGEAVGDFVRRIALAKAAEVSANHAKGHAVLGADTVVMVAGEMLGKPKDRDEGLAMLAKLSGRRHQVLTGVAMVRDGQQAVALDTSDVWFRTLEAGECSAYWETGEPADKAGAYAVQGIGAVFIERIEGSFSGVMGLPLHLTAKLLADFQVPVPGLTGGHPQHA